MPKHIKNYVLTRMRNFKLYSILLFLFVSIHVCAQAPLDPLVRYTSFNNSTGDIEIRWDSSTSPNVA